MTTMFKYFMFGKYGCLDTIKCEGLLNKCISSSRFHFFFLLEDTPDRRREQAAYALCVISPCQLLIIPPYPI